MLNISGLVGEGEEENVIKNLQPDGEYIPNL